MPRGLLPRTGCARRAAIPIRSRATLRTDRFAEVYAMWVNDRFWPSLCENAPIRLTIE